MKKLIFFAFSFIFMVIWLSFSVFAKTSNLDAVRMSDITDALNESSDGDTLNFTIKRNFSITSTITIEKKINLNINFNGYQLKYTGSTTDTAEQAGFYLDNGGATLTLNGVNPIEDYSAYTHYADTKKPDMTGTGNLVSVSKGAVYVNNAYLLSSENAFAINFVFAENNNAYVRIDNSVIRAPQNSTRSAITARGGNNYVSAVLMRKLEANNSVIYGGFKGYDYNFNFTRGTAFTNVKFYDFSIVNDCWYNASACADLLMNSFENAVAMKNCIFHTYQGEVSDIKITTATGKQNIKLIDCTYKGVTGSLSGDMGGNAMVFKVIEMPSCQKEGKALVYAGQNISSSEQSLGLSAHTLGSERIPSYPNGYMQNGIYSTFCALCGAETETNEMAEPLFVNLGISFNEAHTALTLGTYINKKDLKMLKPNDREVLDFGSIVGNEKFEISTNENGIQITNGIRYSYFQKDYDTVDLIINGINDNTRDSKLVMEFYCYDGNRLEYSDGTLQKQSMSEMVENSNVVNVKVKELLKTKEGLKLYYNEDGSFKVMILADLHMNTSGNATDVQEVKDRVKLLVDRENPDFIIFTGDNTINSSSEAKLRANIDAMVSYIEEKQIPWCHVYGNHDHEGALSKEEQQKIYESYEYCVSKDVEPLSGVGNYVLGVYNLDGTLGSAIYLLDSGTYATNGGYDYIKDDQIAWYKETSELLQEYNNGKKVPSMMAFHIPLTENNDAYNNRNNQSIVTEMQGGRNENICCSNTDTNLFEVAFGRGDVKAIVTGHDHINDYMFNYKGIKLCSSPNISDLTYCNANIQGSRVFDLNLKTIHNIPTYVSYIIERINPDKYSDYFETDVVLEDFSSDKTKVEATGYDAGSISGSATVEIIEGANGKLIKVERSQNGNFELDIKFDSEKYARLGNNKFLIVYVDFTEVDFRKSCFGLLSSDGTIPYRTDDKDSNSPFYYLADGSKSWTLMSHGWDGCFGTEQNCSVKGLKGYFALPIANFQKGTTTMSSETLVTGIYIYADISSNDYANKSFYYGNFALTDDYLTYIK